MTEARLPLLSAQHLRHLRGAVREPALNLGDLLVGPGQAARPAVERLHLALREGARLATQDGRAQRPAAEGLGRDDLPPVAPTSSDDPADA